VRAETCPRMEFAACLVHLGGYLDPGGLGAG